MCLKDFKLQPKTSQISKKCVLAKFIKLTSLTKNCAPPQGIYLLTQKADYVEKKISCKTKRNKSDLGEISHIPHVKRAYEMLSLCC